MKVSGAVSLAYSPSLIGDSASRKLDWPGGAKTRARAAVARSAAARVSERLTDGELITLALNGAEPAFSHLLQRHAQHLQRLVSRRLRDPEDVLDVIQDTHLAVWRALQSYDTGRPFEAWLTSIALNKCRDWARRKLVRLALISQLQASGAREGAGIEDHSAESLAMSEEAVHDLERALNGLPQQLREPLILTTLLELSQAAAARRLQATRKAIEMRVRRARQRLEQVLGSELIRRDCSCG